MIKTPPFTVTLQLDYRDRCETVTFTSCSPQWRLVREEYRKGSLVRIPDWVFAEPRRVPRELAYRLGDDCSLYPPDTNRREDGCVVVVLESPHTCEYDSHGHPTGPLQQRLSRRNLEAGLPDLLQAASALFGVALGGKQVILDNAIQYQTSLASLMSVNKLQREVRDEVWTQVFRSGGAENLLGRLEEYQPAFVLVAPTANVREAVRDVLAEAPRHWPWAFAAGHPIYWARSTELKEPVGCWSGGAENRAKR